MHTINVSLQVPFPGEGARADVAGELHTHMLKLYMGAQAVFPICGEVALVTHEYDPTVDLHVCFQVSITSECFSTKLTSILHSIVHSQVFSHTSWSGGGVSTLLTN